MKKSIRALLIMLAVLVVVGGGAAALLLTQPDTAAEESSSSTSVSTEEVINRDTEEISSVSVTNPNASFVLVPVDQETTTSSEEDSSSSSTSTQFTIQGYEGFDLNTSSVTGAVDTVVSIYASKNLGEQEDLEQYGLTGDAATTVEVQYTDGTSDELVVGNEAGESAGRYILKDGIVYISSSFSGALLETPLYFINTEIYSVADRTEETVDSEGSSSTTTLSDVLYHMELSGTHLEQPIVIDYDDSKISTYLITQPIVAESGSNTFTEIVTALKSLTVDSAVAVGRTQETLEQYGLAEPYAQIVFDMNGEDHTLAVSAADSEGNRYLIADDNDVVYQVASSTVDSWAEAELLDLRMSYVWLPNIKDVSAMILTTGDGTEYRFDVERVVNEEESTEDETEYDLVVTNGDGQSVDYENYQDFYQLALSQAVLSTDTVEYSQEDLTLEITYEYFDGSEADVITYCAVPDQEQRLAALLNGGYSGMVRRSEVESLIESLTQVYENQAIE